MSSTKTQPASTPQTPEHPTEGGRYVRNTDGSLTRVHHTKPHEHKGRHAAPAPSKAGSDASPATGSTASQSQE